MSGMEGKCLLCSKDLSQGGELRRMSTIMDFVIQSPRRKIQKMGEKSESEEKAMLCIRCSSSMDKGKESSPEIKKFCSESYSVLEIVRAQIIASNCADMVKRIQEEDQQFFEYLNRKIKEVEEDEKRRNKSQEGTIPTVEID